MAELTEQHKIDRGRKSKYFPSKPVFSVERTCYVCQKPLKINLLPDLSYHPHNYMGDIENGDNRESAELWECDECLKNDCKIDVAKN